MTANERTCTRCGAPVALDAVACPVCGADPSTGPLVVRQSSLPDLPWRQVIGPLAASAAVVAAGAGFRLARRLLPTLRLGRAKPEPPTVVEEAERPVRERIIAVRRRVWAVGDNTGARHWGAEETVWHTPVGGQE